MAGLRDLLRSTHHQLRVLRWRFDYWLMVRDYEASLRRKG
jgi:hypothetical protein